MILKQLSSKKIKTFLRVNLGFTLVSLVRPGVSNSNELELVAALVLVKHLYIFYVVATDIDLLHNI